MSVTKIQVLLDTVSSKEKKNFLPLFLFSFWNSSYIFVKLVDIVLPLLSTLLF